MKEAASQMNPLKDKTVIVQVKVNNHLNSLLYFNDNKKQLISNLVSQVVYVAVCELNLWTK